MMWATVGRYAAAVALGLAVAGTAQMWRYDAKLAEQSEAHTLEMKAVSDAATKAAEAATRRLEAANEALAELDSKRFKELTDANTEIGRLRAGIADGTLGLRVNATCPASGNKAGSVSKAGSVGDAAGPRLTDAAQRDYLALRERINQSTAMIEYLQGYALACSAPQGQP